MVLGGLLGGLGKGQEGLLGTSLQAWKWWYVVHCSPCVITGEERRQARRTVLIAQASLPLHFRLKGLVSSQGQRSKEKENYQWPRLLPSLTGSHASLEMQE